MSEIYAIEGLVASWLLAVASGWFFGYGMAKSKYDSTSHDYRSHKQIGDD